jgi:hypothetical protein
MGCVYTSIKRNNNRNRNNNSSEPELSLSVSVKAAQAFHIIKLEPVRNENVRKQRTKKNKESFLKIISEWCYEDLQNTLWQMSSTECNSCLCLCNDWDTKIVSGIFAYCKDCHNELAWGSIKNDELVWGDSRNVLFKIN